MRKLLIGTLIVLLLLVTAYSVWKGLSIGNIKILGFNNIKSESENIDKQISEITKLKEQDYKKTLSDIESNAKLLLQEKEKYATLVSTSTDSEIEKATHGQKYEQDFLWAKVGNHATAQGVKLKFDIAIGTLNKDNYDLYFTVTGTYTNITEYVLALENDNLLGFKIENFKLLPSAGGTSGSTSADKNNTTNNTVTNTTTDNDSEEDEKSNTNTSNDATNTTSSSKKEEEGTLQATFKVSDIAINIDKTKIKSSIEGTNSALQSIKNQEATNITNSNTVANTTNTTVEGTVEE